MTEYKNQHYVPIFLLKYFDNGDSKTTNLFTIRSKIIVINAPIKDQASEDYFYGSDKIIEKTLGNLEGIFSQLIKAIVETHILPLRGSFEHYLLNLFLISSSARTRHSGDLLNEQLDKMIKVTFRHDPRFSKDIDEVKIGILNPASFSLSIATQNVKYIADLEYKLIINETQREFILSDNPVTKYNHFLKSRRWPYGHAGMGVKGIQYFFPLSPKIYLIMYDQNCYKVGNKNEKIIILKDVNDVDALNKLQALNAYEVMFFNHNIEQDYIISIADWKNANVEITDKVKINEYIKKGSTKEKGSSLIITHTPNIQFELNLSFIKFTKKSKKVVLDNHIVQVRNKRIEKMLELDKRN